MALSNFQGHGHLPNSSRKVALAIVETQYITRRLGNVLLYTSEGPTYPHMQTRRTDADEARTVVGPGDRVDG